MRLQPHRDATAKQCLTVQNKHGFSRALLALLDAFVALSTVFQAATVTSLRRTHPASFAAVGTHTSQTAWSIAVPVCALEA